MAPVIAPPTPHTDPVAPAAAASPYGALLARVDVVVDQRRLGPMSFEEAVSLSRELVRQGIPMVQVRIVQARHPRRAGTTRGAPGHGGRPQA
jgi:hypothetical protein